MTVLLVVVLFLVVFFGILPEFIPKVSRKIVEMIVQESEEEINNREQLQLLKNQLKAISMVDEFAKYARTERKINKLQQDIAKINKSRTEMFLAIKYGGAIGLRILEVITFISLIWTFKREPLLMLPVDWLWPMQAIVAFPTGVPGAVGITCWLLVCRSAISKGKQFLIQ
jgi:predicted PurR-regulated permease PerM